MKEKEQLKRIFGALSEGNKWVEKDLIILTVFSEPEKTCIIGERSYFLFDIWLQHSLF